MRFVIYDGDCGICNKTIMVFAKNDKNNNFKFVSSLSEFDIKVLLKYNIKGLKKSMPLNWLPRLEKASSKQRNIFELSPFRINWEEIDEDLSF